MASSNESAASDAPSWAAGGESAASAAPYWVVPRPNGGTEVYPVLHMARNDLANPGLFPRSAIMHRTNRLSHNVTSALLKRYRSSVVLSRNVTDTPVQHERQRIRQQIEATRYVRAFSRKHFHYGIVV